MAKHTYNRTVWENDNEPDITENNLNNIEEGIVNAQDTANQNVDDIATLNKTVTTLSDTVTNNKSETDKSIESVKTSVTDLVKTVTDNKTETDKSITSLQSSVKDLQDLGLTVQDGLLCAVYGD